MRIRPFRISHFAFRTVVLFLIACNPASTRPAFLPNPQALTSIVGASNDQVVPYLNSWLAGEGFRVEWSNVIDGYVESAWFNTTTRLNTTGTSDPGDLLATIKIRCWVDPYTPGKSQLTVEAVYRPSLDPSRTERDLEVIVPEGSTGYELAHRLVEATQKKFGS
jgi:hypothetical protein